MITTLTVNEDGILTFTDEILQATGWKEGDILEWIDNGDGSFNLVKSDHQDPVLSETQEQE
jgi:bifunctional DNA-binding transcriptional regulator/antitoxin component of YhaV-PrlF toxin-antitoxin module